MGSGETGAHILAVDGGGTHTRAILVGRTGAVIERQEGPGCNPYDRADWVQALGGLLARVSRPGLAGAVLAMAGFDRTRPSSAEHERLIRAALGAFTPLLLENDVEAASFGAFLGGAGTFLLSGTGSVAMSRDGRGNLTRVGGWGWLLGDEGGGYWIGREALSLAGHALDDPDQPFAGFAKAVLEGLGLEGEGANAAESLREWLRTRVHPRSAIGQAAPVVHDLAVAGDPHARALMDDAAGHLAALVRTLWKRSGVTEGRWSHGGSVLASAYMREAVERRLGRAAEPPALSPIGGAALQAAALAEWAPDDAWVARLAGSL